MPLPIDDQTCEMYINLMRLVFPHEDNNLNDATTLVVQLTEGFLCDKKPSLAKADEK